jgi:hypothetical protein
MSLIAEMHNVMTKSHIIPVRRDMTGSKKVTEEARTLIVEIQQKGEK